MSVIAIAVKHMMAAGLSGEVIIAAIAEMEESITPQKSKAALRQERYRERNKTSQSVTSDAKEKSPLIPPSDGFPNPSLTTPLISPQKKDHVPFEEVLEIWNTVLKDLLPTARGWTEKRKTLLRARWADELKRDLGTWRDFCERITRSPFLLGQNDTGWKADLDWALKPNSITKTLEGKYDGTATKRTGNAGRVGIHTGFEKQDYSAGAEGFEVIG
jgi:hypothetical protein